MANTLAIALLAGALVAFLLVYLAPIARQVGLVDTPNERKRHGRDVPLIGGIAIGVTFLLAMLLMPYSLRDYRMLFFSIAVLLVVGILDDRKDVSAGVKFLIEMIVCALLVIIGGVLITDMGDIFARGVSQGLNILAIPFSILALVGVINAFNMIDGHDGLAALTTIVSLTALTCLCYTTGQLHFVSIFLLLIALTGVFLVFNICLLGVSKQVFLGDAGSMFLGLVLGYFLIKLIDVPVPSNYVGSQIVIVKITSAPWILGLPLFDLVVSMVRRVFGMQSIFAADRGHVHHRMTDVGYSKTFTVVILTLIHIIFVSIGVLGTIMNWPDWILFWTPFLLVLVYLTYTIHNERKILSKPWKLN